MSTAPADINAIAQEGLRALQAGDHEGARQRFERLVPTGRMNAAMWLCLALARQKTGDAAGCGAAADEVLAREPRNLRALIFKGDVLSGQGDSRGASAFYGAALRAAPEAGTLPADLSADLVRVEAESRRIAGALEAGLREALAKAGIADPDRAGRVGETLDLLLGRKQLYFQQPKAFYFPGLPQKQFYDRGDFPWMDRVEAATDAIRGELRAILEGENAFAPYVEAGADRPGNDYEGMLGNADWSACFLWKNGTRVDDHADRCPQTLAALADAPLCTMEGRTPSILFSLLTPGAHIPPHTGMMNSRLICHLPLIVPPGCTFRVGNALRDWREGSAWAFDDTIEHEAWNRSNQTRVVLIWEIWRPELNAEERLGVATIFAALDAAGGGATDLSI